ncbi:MAG: hypothetical protein WCJ72_03325 [Chryseobacterium sp.]
MRKIGELQKKYPKYSVESWVADHGIYDNEAKVFIGVPVNSFSEAERTLKWFLTYLDYKLEKEFNNVQGLIFVNWAEQYFNENTLNIEIPKNTMLGDLWDYNPLINFLSSSSFKKKLKWFCELKGLHYDPKERIIRNISGKTTEMILVQS